MCDLCVPHLHALLTMISETLELESIDGESGDEVARIKLGVDAQVRARVAIRPVDPCMSSH